MTWTHHFSTEAPNYTVDPTWFARVETVIDYALARNFWVILVSVVLVYGVARG